MVVQRAGARMVPSPWLGYALAYWLWLAMAGYGIWVAAVAGGAETWVFLCLLL